MTTDEAKNNIGREVRYDPFHGADPEFGVITSANDTIIFVRYDGDRHPKATSPEDLTFTQKRHATGQ